MTISSGLFSSLTTGFGGGFASGMGPPVGAYDNGGPLSC
jgi:hypothetical protein